MLALATVDQAGSWTEIELAGVVPAEQGRGRYGHLLAAVEDAASARTAGDLDARAQHGGPKGVGTLRFRAGSHPADSPFGNTPDFYPVNRSRCVTQALGATTPGAKLTARSLVAARPLVAPARACRSSIGSGGDADRDVDADRTADRAEENAVVTPRLSVVVPFYNVRDYIGDCLDSIARQTWTDFEAILVDDGSPDDSAAIAKEFCARDPRFRIVEQENQGLGPARNTGVRQRRGRVHHLRRQRRPGHPARLREAGPHTGRDRFVVRRAATRAGSTTAPASGRPGSTGCRSPRTGSPPT